MTRKEAISRTTLAIFDLFFLLGVNFPLPNLVLELTGLWQDKSKCCSVWCIAAMQQSIKFLQYHGYAGAHSISTPPQNPTACLYNQRGNRGITNLVTWPNSQSQAPEFVLGTELFVSGSPAQILFRWSKLVAT